MIECKTYRWRAHTERKGQPDPRDQEEVERWKVKDPIAQLARRMRDQGVLDDAGLQSIDREVMRAASAQINDPQRAADLWSQVDRDVVDEAGWVPFYNYQSVEFVSKRVGNYQYNPWWRSLLDQLWVR